MRWLCLLIIPMALIPHAMALREAAGPFWLGNNSDPDYLYLLNALALSQLQPVGHSHHPGSTLQWLGALILWVSNRTTGGGASSPADVLRRPELYLHVIHAVLVLGCVAGTAISGLLAFRATGRLHLALLIQAGPLISLTLQKTLYRVTPEALVTPLSIMMAAIIFAATVTQRSASCTLAVVLGALSGLGLATKITFAPVVILPLVMLPGLWYRAYYLACTVIGFFVVTLNPLIGLLDFFRFTKTFIRREGYNEPIVAGSTTFDTMMNGLASLTRQLWQTDVGTLICIVACLLVTSAVWLTPSFRRATSRDLRVGLAGTGLALLVQLALVSTGPGASAHYLVPALGLLGLWLALIAGLPHQIRGSDHARLLTRGSVVAVAVILLTTVPSLLALPGELRRDRSQWLRAYEYVTHLGKEDDVVVNYYRSSHPVYALYLGNEFARSAFQEELQGLHPGYIQYDRWDGQFYRDFGSATVRIEDVVKSHRFVLVQGSRDVELRLPAELSTTILFETEVERVLLVQLRDRGPGRVP
jgi:hypothetical protein